MNKAGELAPEMMMSVFGFFNEIGIINQLSNAALAKALPDGVHPSHFAIINHLVRMGDGKTPIRIAGAMQVTKTTMTHSLKVLLDRAFIEVRPNPEDARGKLVFLTEKGHAFRVQAIQNVMEQYGRIIEPKHIELMHKMLPGLTEMRKHLDDNRSV